MLAKTLTNRSWLYTLAVLLVNAGGLRSFPVLSRMGLRPHASPAKHILPASRQAQLQIPTFINALDYLSVLTSQELGHCCVYETIMA
jgi:hypothetical protein